MIHTLLFLPKKYRRYALMKNKDLFKFPLCYVKRIAKLMFFLLIKDLVIFISFSSL
jgi:hypothetical protein